jgi:hypothetical protein
MPKKFTKYRVIAAMGVTMTAGMILRGLDPAIMGRYRRHLTVQGTDVLVTRDCTFKRGVEFMIADAPKGLLIGLEEVIKPKRKPAAKKAPAKKAPAQKAAPKDAASDVVADPAEDQAGADTVAAGE